MKRSQLSPLLSPLEEKIWETILTVILHNLPSSWWFVKQIRYRRLWIERLGGFKEKGRAQNFILTILEI